MSTERRILGMFPHRLMHHDETLYVRSRSFTKKCMQVFFLSLYIYIYIISVKKYEFISVVQTLLQVVTWQ